jgi:hypothetical protein
MLISLRSALAEIGEPVHSPLGLRSSFGRRLLPSLRTAIAGMNNPRVEQWQKVGLALWSENTTLSEKAQGVTTDGHRWYVCSNEMKGVVAFDNSKNRVATYLPSPAIFNQMRADAGSPEDWQPHFGAPNHHQGWIYVAIQAPHGVWRFRVDHTQQEWRKADRLEDGNLFAWCAVHPVTGVLYTCNFDRPTHLRSYKYNTDTLTYRPNDNIELGRTSLDLDKVQGGTFTSRGRLLLVRWSFNAVFCFSSLNGHCFGALKLGNFGSNSMIGSEVEGITVRNWSFDGVSAHIHILELDKDAGNPADDFYLHSYQVPDPDRL